MPFAKSRLRKAAKGAAILFFYWGLLVATAHGVFAAADDRAEIIENARQEGVVVVYSSTQLPILEEIRLAFEKKYPFLKVDTVKTGAVGLITRSLTEHRAGRHLADVFGPSFWGSYPFFEEGLLGAYRSPEREAIPNFFKDKDGLWACDYINVGVIAYNTKVVPANKVPKSYQDFLDPWWKGKLMLDDTGDRWYTCMLEILGEEKGRNFMQKLAQQKITINRGQELKVQLLAAGESAAIINSFNGHIELVKTKGAPVEWVAPLDQPSIPTPHLVTMAKRAPHPNAAKLYIDFALSKEGQQIIARMNTIPSRADVLPNPPRLMLGADGKRLQFLAVDSEVAKKAIQRQKEFRKLFMPHR